MRDDFLPISKPTISEAEIAEVVDTLRSGWITTGPKTQRFEEEFAAFVGVPHALAVSSATGGLHIGLIALGLKPGDEVITTPITWAATVNMVEALDATPIFVDVDPATLQIDTAQVEAAITERTVGILPVHFAGAPSDLAALASIADRYDLWIFEDAAHGVGTRAGGRHVGSTSALSVFSFHPIKNMTTIEGGVLTLTDDELERALRALRFHGLEKSAWNRYAAGGTPQVQVTRPGFKYNFTDVQASLGIHQLAAVEGFNQRRRELAALYHELLAEVPEIQRPAAPTYDHDHTWHLYVIQVLPEAGLSRDEMMAALRERNVGTGLHFVAVHTQPYYAQKYPQWLGALPAAERASDRLCSLPLYPSMTEDDVRYVVAAIQDVLVHARR
ncbi:MAG: aminotransferase class I/II-fold pyridoxal phosphate-dependent enzyme [Acidobacteria bacterium]|nr:aminotransferase class I/II-fold pyridoxal phosphate-dependent enzyme [Acidobacteriota bacterium]